MSSEAERPAGVVLRELRADRHCRDGCDCARCAYDRRILNAMIEQIERRVLAQQPCYCVWMNQDTMDCALNGIELCPTCTARQTQETSG